MKSKIFTYILLIAVCAAASACSTSKAASNETVEVFFEDKDLAKSNTEEVVFDDRSLGLEHQQTFAGVKNSSEVPRRLADGSEITVQYDGYGNKTETRIFNNHPRITTILVRTAANGQKQIYAYGYGNDVKIMPAEMSGLSLTSSADEIAKAAGLYETRSNEDLTNFRKQPNTLQPLPSSSFPMQMPPSSIQTEQSPQITQTEQPEKSTVDVESNVSNAENPASNLELEAPQN